MVFRNVEKKLKAINKEMVYSSLQCNDFVLSPFELLLVILPNLLEHVLVPHQRLLLLLQPLPQARHRALRDVEGLLGFVVLGQGERKLPRRHGCHRYGAIHRGGNLGEPIPC